jgi:hypothetical protein
MPLLMALVLFCLSEMTKTYKTASGTTIKVGKSGGKQFKKTNNIRGGNKTTTYNYMPPRKGKPGTQGGQ